MLTSLGAKERDIVSCNGCPFRWDAGRAPVAFNGTSRARLMVILPHPSWVDVRDKHIGAGFEGQFVTRQLINEGVKRSEIFLTSLVKCMPRYIKKKGYQPVSPIATEVCPPLHLLDELELVNPELIIAVGAEVMHHFGIKGGINKMSGKVYETDYGFVLPVIHPNKCSKEPRTARDLRTYCALASLYLQGKANVQQPEFWRYE